MPSFLNDFVFIMIDVARVYFGYIKFTNLTLILCDFCLRTDANLMIRTTRAKCYDLSTARFGRYTICHYLF